MLLWVSLVVVATLLMAAIALIAAMMRAERRTRRTLYRSLGLNDETVDLLMARNRDVPSELALVRLQAVSPPMVSTIEVQDSEGQHMPSVRSPPALRLVGGAASPDGEARSGAVRRRLPRF